MQPQTPFLAPGKVQVSRYSQVRHRPMSLAVATGSLDGPPALADPLVLRRGILVARVLWAKDSSRCMSGRERALGNVQLGSFLGLLRRAWYAGILGMSSPSSEASCTCACIPPRVCRHRTGVDAIGLSRTRGDLVRGFRLGSMNVQQVPRVAYVSFCMCVLNAHHQLYARPLHALCP